MSGGGLSASLIYPVLFWARGSIPIIRAVIISCYSIAGSLMAFLGLGVVAGELHDIVRPPTSDNCGLKVTV